MLIGMPGTGKTTTGRRLARMLAVPFADSDALVETRTGRTVAELFAEVGEAAFRAHEAAAVQDALSDFAGVLALGGGAVLDAGTRAALADSGVPVVLLRAEIATLAGRVGDGHVRPLLGGDHVARLSQLSADRDAVYVECATLTADTDRRTPAQVAAHIAARLHDPASARQRADGRRAHE